MLVEDRHTAPSTKNKQIEKVRLAACDRLKWARKVDPKALKAFDADQCERRAR